MNSKKLINLSIIIFIIIIVCYLIYYNTKQYLINLVESFYTSTPTPTPTFTPTSTSTKSTIPTQGSKSLIQVGENIYNELEDNTQNIMKLETNDKFGFCISLNYDGNVIAVGSHYGNGLNENAVEDKRIKDCGTVSIYKYIEKKWQRYGSIIYGEARNNYSGESLQLSNDGNKIIIGSFGNNRNRGNARVYEYKLVNKNEIEQKKYIFNKLLKNNRDIPIETKPIIVTPLIGGKYQEPKENNFYWVQMGTDIRSDELNPNYGLSNNNDNELEDKYINAKAGKCVSISGNGKIIGICYPNSEENKGNYGKVNIYQYTNMNNWELLGQNIYGEYEFGKSVSLNNEGNIVAIEGLYKNNEYENEYDLNYVIIYKFNKDTYKWDIIGNINNTVEYGSFLDSYTSIKLSNDGKRIAIGYYNYLNSLNNSNNDKGIFYDNVRVFEYRKVIQSEVEKYKKINENNNKPIIVTNKNNEGGYEDILVDKFYWIQLGKDIKSDKSNSKIISSYSLSMDYSGNKIIIGSAYGYDEKKIIKGNVRILNYNNENNIWEQIGNNFYGKNENDRLGICVDISSNGNRICFTTLKIDGFNSVSIFEFPTVKQIPTTTQPPTIDDCTNLIIFKEKIDNDLNSNNEVIKIKCGDNEDTFQNNDKQSIEKSLYFYLNESSDTDIPIINSNDWFPIKTTNILSKENIDIKQRIKNNYLQIYDTESSRYKFVYYNINNTDNSIYNKDIWSKIEYNKLSTKIQEPTTTLPTTTKAIVSPTTTQAQDPQSTTTPSPTKTTLQTHKINFNKNALKSNILNKLNSDISNLLGTVPNTRNLDSSDYDISGGLIIQNNTNNDTNVFSPIIRYKNDAKNPQYEYSPVYKNANLLNQMVNKPHSDSNIVQQLFSKYLK